MLVKLNSSCFHVSSHRVSAGSDVGRLVDISIIITLIETVTFIGCVFLLRALD